MSFHFSVTKQLQSQHCPFVCSFICLFVILFQSVNIKCQNQVSESSVKIKCQNQVSKSSIKIKHQNQASKLSIKIKHQNQASKSSVKIEHQNQASKSNIIKIMVSQIKHSDPLPPLSTIKRPKYCFMAILKKAFCESENNHFSSIFAS